MTTRIWRGRTSRKCADEYAAFLTRHAIPDQLLKARDYPEDECCRSEFEPEVQRFTLVARSP